MSSGIIIRRWWNVRRWRDIGRWYFWRRRHIGWRRYFGRRLGSSNCLLYGTIITMADGRRVPIEMLRPGDELQSLVVPGLKTDVPFKAQYQWLSTWGLEGASMRPARVSHISIGEHDGFFVINRRIKATFEHPFLVRRGDAWGFCSADMLQVGDCLITPSGAGHGDEQIDSIGGFDSEDTPLLDVDIYNVSSQTWRKGPSIPGARRNGFAPAAYVSSGAVWLSVSSGEVFRLSSDQTAWEPVQSTAPRVAHRMVDNADNVLLVGGADESRMLDLVEAVSAER